MTPPSSTQLLNFQLSTSLQQPMSNTKIPLGPSPTLLSHRQVYALYEILQALVNALEALAVPYVITGGSLLGAVRQHSILFCDDDVDIAILGEENYKCVQLHLQETLGSDFLYSIKPWIGSDRVRYKKVSNVFCDVFCIREYETEEDLMRVISFKENGQPQSETYVQNILSTMQQAVGESQSLFPCWQFDTRKAIELWPKEVYLTKELFPLVKSYKMGPVVGISSPRMPLTLLKRAFGDDCFDVYYPSHSHTDNTPTATTTDSSHYDESHDTSNNNNNNSLPPLVFAGGTWEHNKKAPLLDEHYLPMQPLLKSKRRHTLHNKQRLLDYLQEQSKVESNYAQQDSTTSTTSTVTTVYMDGVFDLFHVGHLQAIQQCSKLGGRVIIGVTGDRDASNYKRPPILSQQDRVCIVEAIQHVHLVICPCPLVVTKEFILAYGIDLVVHGFSSEQDAKSQEHFFEYPIRIDKFQRIEYYKDLSTTDIIRKIQQLDNNGSVHDNGNAKDETILTTQQQPLSQQRHLKWFGTSLATATNKSPTIPYDPFPLHLRAVVEPHVAKARVRRDEALTAIRQASEMDESEFQQVITAHSVETDFKFDTDKYPLRQALLECTNLSHDTDMSQLHTNPTTKDSFLQALTENYHEFQQVYDKFVLEVCVPRLAASATCNECDEIYYQAFPCVRVVQPGDFSIGPHADVAYGHHPWSVNFYLPLTILDGTASLFLESRMGSEDWHPIVGDYGTVKQFAGGVNLHWTPENMQNYTRVSLDFRLIPGKRYHALACTERDVYRKSRGYYSCCQLQQNGTWKRVGELPPPDHRVGFPWTVGGEWGKYYSKSKNKKQRNETS